MPELTEERKKLLKYLVDHFDGEDKATRNRQIRTCRKLKFLWDNLQYHYYSEVAHDWRVPEQDVTGDQSYYDKPVNVFRAYLESIIAALSVSVPSVTCYPEDAEDPLDLLTARAGDKIARLISRHNDSPLLWLHALFIYCTEGMLACYSYPKEDKAFGTYENKKYEDVEEIQNHQVCPSCQGVMASTPEEFLPEGQQDICPSCNQAVIPQTETSTSTQPVLKEIEHLPKSRVLLDVYGLLYVKVPVYARKQSDCPYLIFNYETHYSNVLELYPELKNIIKGGTASYDSFEQWGRLSPQYKGEYPINNVTVRNAWLRPSAFNVLAEDKVKEFQDAYPDGVKVVLVNDHVADAEPENLDDYWTLSYNPLSDYIHFDPLGLLLTSIQEITNDILSLTIQTIEHGIPQTFANPKYIDFKAYANQEVIPGGIYPTISTSGKIADGFYEVKTATLSGEVLPFAQKVQEMGQLVSGALPSLFGGMQAEGGRTATEYSMSRAQALQRLQNTWKTLTLWWKNIFGRAIPLYIQSMKEDEKSVEKDEMGKFINVFIRKTDLEGKIGKIELEASENLPLTWSQRKDALMELFQLNNPEVLKAIASPENMEFLRESFGLTDYTIPGEDDRTKQYEEIVQLVNSEPLSMPGDMGMNPMTGIPEQTPDQQIPSVDIDPDVDDNAIQAEICRAWLVSDAGRLAKTENQTGYMNVLLHMKAHKEAMMAQSAAMLPQPMNQPPAPTGDENA